MVKAEKSSSVRRVGGEGGGGAEANALFLSSAPLTVYLYLDVDLPDVLQEHFPCCYGGGVGGGGEKQDKLLICKLFTFETGVNARRLLPSLLLHFESNREVTGADPRSGGSFFLPHVARH